MRRSSGGESSGGDDASDINTVNAIVSVSDYNKDRDPVEDRDTLRAVEESDAGEEEASVASDGPAQEMVEADEWKEEPPKEES